MGCLLCEKKNYKRDNNALMVKIWGSTSHRL
jgi:hypothetical protein